MATTKITGKASANNYGFYANVIVGDFNKSTQKFPVTIDLYLVNNGIRTNSGGWTNSITCDGTTKSDSSQTINTTGVSASGGKTKVYSKSFNVSIKSTISVSATLSKSSYSTYDPGRCTLSGSISLPKVQSTWESPILPIIDVEDTFTLGINKYVSSYYNVAEVRNLNHNTLIKTINDANDGDEVTFTSSELNTIYTIDNNKYQLPLRFLIDLKTYTNSSKITQIGGVQSLLCEAYIVNGEPTATYTIVEQDEKVIELLGSSTSNNIIKNASDLLFTITPTALNEADILSVKVNDTPATLSNNVYTLNINDITTGTFNIVVTDTRNLTQTYIIEKTIIDYTNVSINTWSIKRQSQTSSNLILNADINCYSSTISGATNTPVVQYSTDGTNWATISSSSYTFADDKITITNLTLNNVISHQVSGTFYLKVYDLLSEVNDNKDVAVGIYTFAKSDRKVRINGTLEIADSNAQNRFEIRKPITYSDEETFIGYYVMNGVSKPIYRTVLQTHLPSTADTSGTLVSNNDLPANLKQITRIDGMLTEQQARFPLNSYYTSGYYNSVYWEPGSGIKGRCGSSLVGRSCELYIEYTKT